MVLLAGMGIPENLRVNRSRILRAPQLTGTKDKVRSAVTDQRLATAKTREITSAHAWFAGGERIGYDPNARAIVRAQDAPLSVFLRREGDLAHTVSFLPGFPDGSFGWAKVLPYLRKPSNCNPSQGVIL